MVEVYEQIDDIQSEAQHYVLIKDFNSFMYDKTKHKERKYFCMYCLQHFTSENRLNDHKNDCITINGEQAIRMPKEGENILKFDNHQKQIPVPFVIYADFEAIVEKVHGCAPSTDSSYTEAYQKHTACGYCYKVVCCNDEYSKPDVGYRGEEAASKFMDAMLEEVEYCLKTTNDLINKYKNIENCDRASYNKTKNCCICENKFVKTESKGAYYCQITGKPQGTAHKDCIELNKINMNKMKIPVVFHNLRGYDSHFIIQEIGGLIERNVKDGKSMNINVIPNNMEKYMAFMLGDHLTFIDSFQFMSSSLDRLVSNLPKNALKYTGQSFSGEQLDLVSRKGVYPYDYMDSFDRFNDKQLPTKEAFFSTLTGEHISDEDYEHAQTVWKTFGLKKMGNYHNLYLKTDVLLLSDVFENFRKTCLEYYKLDPCHYFTFRPLFHEEPNGLTTTLFHISWFILGCDA